MDNLASEIKRKIRIRKFAMDNTGCNEEENRCVNDNFNNADNEIQKLYSQLYENIEGADQSKIQNGYSSITSKRKLSKLIVFIKKAIRKIINVLFGWYIKPILEKQTFFNGKTVNSVNLMRQILMLQEQNYSEKIKELENKITSFEKSDSITELSNMTHELEDRITSLEKSDSIAELSNMTHELEDRITSLEKGDSIAELSNMTHELEDKVTEISNSTHELENKMSYVFDRLNVSCDINILQKNDMDYFKFESNFRGSRSSIKEVQSVYVPYFKANSDRIILDIGCGRGEFLELMSDNGITAYGVDSYEPFVNYCSERGFNVQMSDALTHLYSLEDCSLGGIFMSQVVEHLSNDYIRTLITTAYKKLKPGCYFILETPNPDCLAAISEFNIDMSHIKPIHYKALEYLFKEANFTSIERYHTEQTLYPVSAKHIEGTGINNLEEFNQGIDFINGLLFGFRDYTLIAKK